MEGSSMEVKEEKLQELKTLGFTEKTDNNKIFYYEKKFGCRCKIRVGMPYVTSNFVEFHCENRFGEDEEITACVPIWAFPTIVKMVQMGFIEED